MKKRKERELALLRVSALSAQQMFHYLNMPRCTNHTYLLPERLYNDIYAKFLWMPCLFSFTRAGTCFILARVVLDCPEPVILLLREQGLCT